MQGNYTILEHTADLGIEITSPTLDGLYEIAGQALFDLITPKRSVPRIRHWIKTVGEDRETLLANFMNDMLFQFDLHGMLFRIVKVWSLTSRSLTAETWCEKLDPETDPVERVVKAVTLHNLKVEENAAQWRGVVFLDL
ncbi:MAG: archease [Planctomycetota bacterium]